jgi:small subunit ribosomal protein S20
VGIKIHQSVLKRERQSLKVHHRNKSIINRIKSMVKNIQVAITSKNLTEAERLLPATVSTIDKAAVKGIIHRNTAARKVSRLTRDVQHAKSAPADKSAAGKARPAAS